MNDEEIEYITDLLFNENWKEQKDLILFTKDLKTANRRLAEQVNQLQSNWNSLREYYKRKAEETKNSTALYDKWTKYSSVVDKMNELEGKDKE